MAHYDYRCKPCARICTLTIPLKDFDTNFKPECDTCGEPMKRVWNGHIPVKLAIPKTGAGRRGGTPWYGGPDERERKMEAARRAANPGAY